MKREAAAGHRAWCLRNTVEGSSGEGGWGLFRGLVSPPVFGLRTRQEVAAGRWGDKQVTRAFSKATKWRVSLYIFPTKKYNLFFDAGSTPLVTWLFFLKRKSCPLSFIQMFHLGRHVTVNFGQRRRMFFFFFLPGHGKCSIDGPQSTRWICFDTDFSWFFGVRVFAIRSLCKLFHVEWRH